jgi:hypothetical protein
MTESNEVKIPQYYRMVVLLEVDDTTYDGMLLWDKTPEQIEQSVKKGIRMTLPPPCHDYEVQSIEPVYGCGIGGALRQRIDKITKMETPND